VYNCSHRWQAWDWITFMASPINKIIVRFQRQESTAQDGSDTVLLVIDCLKSGRASGVQHWNPFRIFWNHYNVIIRDGEEEEEIRGWRKCWLTYKIESVTVAFSVNFRAFDELLKTDSLPERNTGSVISTEDETNHWVAAAYCRQISFNLSIFCNCQAQ